MCRSNKGNAQKGTGEYRNKVSQMTTESDDDYLGSVSTNIQHVQCESKTADVCVGDYKQLMYVLVTINS